MSRRRGLVSVAVAAAVLATAAGMVALVRALSTPASPGPDPAWRVLPGAFEPEGTWMSGPRVLMAADPCFVAFGSESTGYGMIPVTWGASGDCSRPVHTSEPWAPLGDGLPSENRAGFVAAVPAHGGGVLALSRRTFAGDAYGFDTSVMRCRYDGGCEEVASFSAGREGHVGPNAVIAIDEGYVAVGRRSEMGTVWTSPDGIEWTESTLPEAAGGFPSAIVAATDGRLVVVGTSVVYSYTDAQPVAWVSEDNATTWTRSTLPAVAAGSTLESVVYNGHRYLALGAGGDSSLNPALVLSSIDGATWVTEPVPAEMPGLSAAIVTGSGAVVAVDTSSAPPDARPSARCARAWILLAEAWHAEEIGCRGVPDALVELSDGRLVAAHWDTLFLRNPV